MKKFQGIFVAFIFTMIIIILITSRITVFSRIIPDTDEFSSTIDHGWKYAWESKEYSGNLNLPCVVDGGYSDKVLWITNTLPEYDSNNAVLLIRTSQQYLKAFIDGKLIYSYEYIGGRESYLLPGSSWHLVKLPLQFSGKKIELSFVSPYKKYAGNINQIYLGSESSVLLDIITSYGLVLIISCVTLLIGLTLILLYFFFQSGDGRFRSLLYLGHFSLLSGVWMASESKIVQLFVNSPVLIYYTACLSLFLLPIPLLHFIISTYSPKNSNILKWLILILRVFFIAVSLLQVIYNGTFMNILPVYHVLLAACIVAILCISIIEMKNNNNSIRLFFTGCIVLCAFSALDMFHFYFSNIPGLNAQKYMQFAVLLFIILLLASLGQYILEILNYEMRNKAYKELAYTDILTGLKNRTSYEEKIVEINENIEIREKVIVIIFDLNNLKRVNDSFGHQAGDRLIVQTSRLIRESFGQIGEVYRIGGDEFAVVMIEADEAEVADMASLFNSKIREYNIESNEVQIGVAYGQASYDKNRDSSLHSVIVRADEEMYRCKKLQKEAV